MKKILFASTAFAGLAIAGVASADVALFGTARLGLGYNIVNNGEVDYERDGESLVGSEDFRAVSRIRFGFTGTGETDSGITFGATIRADNASLGGSTGSSTRGTIEGNLFVSGAWGTLTYGDTNGADEQHVGDAGGQFSLTGLGDLNETPFVSNGGGFGDDSIQAFNNPSARPTVRYDYNFGGFGVSASTNRNLNDIGVGASYTADFAGGSVTGGLGYYDYNEFTDVDTNDPLFTGAGTVRGGEQYSAGVTGNFGGFGAGVVYSVIKSEGSDDADEITGGDIDYLNVNLSYTIDAWSAGVYYAKVLEADDGFAQFDGSDSYGASVAYDLGGGAAINFGIAQTYGRDGVGVFDEGEFSTYDVEDATVADFGITMAF